MQRGEWESGANRKITFDDPSNYKGRDLTGMNFIVNGVLRKQDGWYRSLSFQPVKIGGFNIYIGKCPTEPSHFMKLKSLGIDAAFNLMHESEFTDITFHELKNYY